MTMKLEESRRARFYVALVSLAIFRLWIMGMSSSLWLDETVTYWSVYKGVRAASVRAQFWPGQNALFMAITASVVRIAGQSEIALRLPSLLAGVAAAYLVFRFGAHLFDKESGLLAASVFVSLHELWRTLPTARPYALALLVSLGSIWHLVQWMDRGRNRNAVGYALMTALIPYFHYAFAVCYLVLAIYIFYRLRTRSAVSWARAIAVSAVIFLLLLPLIWNAIYGKHLSPTSLSVWTATPSLEEFVTAFIHPVLAGGIFLGVLAGCALGLTACDGEVSAITPANRVLLLTWITVPILTLFLVSELTPFKCFIPRYYMLAFPALALLIGRLIRILPATMRLTVSASVVLSALLSFTGLHARVAPHAEDWRAAAQIVKAAHLSNDTAVLVRVGLVETSKATWDLEISPDSPLLSPLSKYPVPGHVFLLPYVLNADTLPYLDELVTKIVQPSAEFVVMARDEKPEVLRWLMQESSNRGFAASSLGNPPGITVLLFRRGLPGPVARP
jgi:mannosyltransferase